MYRNAYQRGLLTVFFSGGAKPLNIWDTYTQDGYITRFLDQDIKSMVLEIGGTNVSTTYMVCPKGSTVLGITMPFLVMVVKNLKKYFTFEVTILDETGTRRRFRVSNFQSTTQILPLCTVMPIGLSEGWNQIQFNLAEFTRRAYKKQYVEVQKLKVNANIRLRRIYFAERLLPEDQLPPEYKLYFPLPHKAKMKKAEEAKDKENIAAPVPVIEEKKPEEEKPTERISSKAEVARTVSKASVHSVKKTSSRQSSRAILEEAGSKRASVAEAPVEAPVEAPGEGAPAEGEVPEGPRAEGGEAAEGGEVTEGGGEEHAPGPEGEPASDAPVEDAPEEAPKEEAAAPAAEEAPPPPEEPTPEPQGEEPAPEAPTAE